MVAVSDIPILGKVVETISEAGAGAIFRGFRYLFCYKKLVDDLDTEIKKVDIQAREMFKKTEKEQANGKIIKAHVSAWQEDVDEFQESAKEFSEKYKNRSSWTCLKCLPIPNPASRFQLGREAVQKAKGATQLLDSGKELMLHEIADLPPTENLPKQSDVAFQDFASRKYVYGKLWNALEAEGGSPVIGIYGMAGVGKTRMMEQLWKQAMEEKKFDRVVRANVGSEELNVLKLQDQIAADLNCRFDSQDNVKSRANQLKNSLMYWKKVLVIFDDIWTEIPIEDIIGTGFGESSSSKGSKILLTSRREDVCLKNKCQRPVHITTLEDEEAWDLFQKTVGTDHINHLGDDDLAKKVCAKCAGLPLLIRAVGKALEFKPPNHHVWNDALKKLETGKFKKIAGIDRQAYACVKLSIDTLQEEDAKLCLFLCSLFPEDADIHITTLIQFAIGSQLIDDAESAIPTMVDVLTKSSLLLECNVDHITRMHDVIRDVSRFEASSEGSKYKFFHVKSGGSRLTDNAGYNTSKLLRPKLLRLDVEGDQFHFPKYLVSTDLYTLWLHCNNHLQQFPGDHFFGMFVNLGFLILQKVQSLPEHFSLEPLGELNMLIFDGCDIRNTDVGLFPKNLNTLCIWDCHLPSPLDLSTLNNLLRLDIQQEFGEVVMVRNAMSSLSRLEEMHIPNGIRFSDDATGVTLILDEISKLTCLRSLKISFRDFEPCQGTATFKKLSKYDIFVGRRRKNWKALPKSTKIIELNDVEVKGDEGIQSLLERAEKVTLRSTDVDVSSICQSNREAFTDLKELTIINSCDPVEYIARISQDEIQHSRQLRASFSKLTILEIISCSAMKYLFCKSVAKCLGQLQELEVDVCPAMEAIVMDEGTDDGEIIVFSKLRRLRLWDLESLRSFYRKNKEMHRGSTDNSVISCAQFPPLFDEMVAFPSLENLEIRSLEHTTCIWGNSVSSTSFRKLKELRVYLCNKLESVIPVSMLNRLQNLEDLDIEECSSLRNAFPPCIARNLIRVRHMNISYCGMMTEIIGGGGDEQKEKEISPHNIGDHDIIVFPKLTRLILMDLENLTSFWGHLSGESNRRCKVEFPCLVSFSVRGCGEINWEAMEFGREDSTCQLEYLYIWGNKQMHLPCKWKLHFHNLETLALRGCWWPLELKSLHFPNLKHLEVSRCGRSALFTISGFKSLKQLKTLRISDCDLLEEIVEDVRGDELDEMDTKTIIELLQLHSVVLRDLPNLKSFLGGANYECYMPALTELEVNKCGLSSLLFFGDLQPPESMNFSKLKTLRLVSLQSPISFYREKKEMHSGLTDNSAISSVQFQPLFDGMVAFPSLEKLIIEDLEITDIWGEHNSYNNIVSSSSSFCKLERLDVKKCSKLESVIPVGMLDRLQNLEYLNIEECRSLKYIVDDGRGEIRNLYKLETLGLKNLGSFTSFNRKKKEMHSGLTDSSVISSIQFKPLFDGMVAFPSLKELIIEDLEITDIWEEHNSNNNIVSSSFCKLKKLEVKKCSKLESVIPVDMLDRLQNLERLTISDCSSLRNAFPPCIARDLINLQRVRISGCDMMREIIGGADEQKEKEITGDHDLIIVFPKLTMLELVNLKNLTTFWYYEGRECNTCTYKVEFSCLETFSVDGCGEINLEAIEFGREDSTCQLKKLKISSDKQMHLPCKWKLHFDNLETLQLRGCWWRELKSLHFPNLRKLDVSRCGRSALFTISDFRSLKQLKTLRISDCDLLEEIVEDVRGDGHDEMDKKTVTELLQLRLVVFKDLPNLKSFTHGANYECYMPALKKMGFVNCGLSSLFTCSVFRNLQQLDELVVSNCRLLEAIVEDGREDGETSETNDKIIIHSNLVSVTLEDLARLSSFSCSESYAFNMSGLKKIHLLQCPRLENLNEIKASTEIVYVHTEHGYEKVTDLNDFITKHRKRGSNFVALRDNQVTNQELETDSGIVEE